jgi:hypothetical protein
MNVGTWSGFLGNTFTSAATLSFVSLFALCFAMVLPFKKHALSTHDPASPNSEGALVHPTQKWAVNYTKQNKFRIPRLCRFFGAIYPADIHVEQDRCQFADRLTGHMTREHLDHSCLGNPEIHGELRPVVIPIFGGDQLCEEVDFSLDKVLHN